MILSKREILLMVFQGQWCTHPCLDHFLATQRQADSKHMGSPPGPSIYLQVNLWGRGKHSTARGVMGLRGFSFLLQHIGTSSLLCAVGSTAHLSLPEAQISQWRVWMCTRFPCSLGLTPLSSHAPQII